jgi:hypothetical protein
VPNESIASDRGTTDNLSGLLITPAGDVGKKVQLTVPGTSPVTALGAAQTVNLPSGQSISMTVRELSARKDGAERYTILSGHDAVYDLAQRAPKRSQIYRTMTRNQELEYSEKTKNDTPRYDLHKQIGDEYGCGGWTNEAVALHLALQAGLDDFKTTVPKTHLQQVVVRENVTFIDAVMAIYKVQSPALWIADNILFVIDLATFTAFVAADPDIPTITSGLLAARTITEPPVGTNETVYIRGGLGRFRPDKYPGKTWTTQQRIGSTLSKADIGIKSKLISEMLSMLKYYAGYLVCEHIDRGELFTVETKEVWSLDVLGRRWITRESANYAGTEQGSVKTRGNVLLLEVKDKYKTFKCESWQDTSGTCSRGYRCNGRGTTTTCDSYVPRDEDREHVERVEVLNIYEGMSFDILRPRKTMSITSISGKVWALTPKHDGIMQRWIDPLKIGIKKINYDEFNGIVINQTSTIRACVYATADCTNYDADAPGGCTVGVEPCKHYINGFCELNLPCNRYGRLSTCDSYTGTHRTCGTHDQGIERISKETQEPEDVVFHYLDNCPDTTVEWKELADAKQDSISIDSIFKTSLVGTGDPTNTPSTGDPVDGEAKLDPECLIEQTIIRHLQVDPYMCREIHDKSYLHDGKMKHEHIEENRPSTAVDQHPLTKRMMTVFGEKGPDSPPLTSKPRYDREDSNLVDWDDAQKLAERLHAQLSEIAVDDTYTVPGELILERGTPISMPDNTKSTHLLSGVTGVGLVEGTEVRTTTSSNGEAQSLSVIKVTK